MVPEQLRPGSGGSKHGPAMERGTLPRSPKPQAPGICFCFKSMHISSVWPKFLAPNGSGLNLSNFNPFSFRTQSFRGLVPPAFPQVPQRRVVTESFSLKDRQQGFHITKLDKSQDRFLGERTPCISTCIYITLPSYRSTHQAMAHIHLRLPELVQLSGCKICLAHLNFRASEASE